MSPFCICDSFFITNVPVSKLEVESTWLLLLCLAGSCGGLWDWLFHESRGWNSLSQIQTLFGVHTPEKLTAPPLSYLSHTFSSGLHILWDQVLLQWYSAMFCEVVKEDFREANCCVSLVVILHGTMFAFQNPFSIEVINHLIAFHKCAAAQPNFCLTGQADFSKYSIQERWKGALT